MFLRLPIPVAEALDAAAQSLDLAKSTIVAELLSRQLGAEPPVGIDALRGAPIGRHSFTPVHELEVLTLEQLATLLDVGVDATRELAEAGDIPGRKIGGDWRFAREAVMDWLAGK